MPLFQKIISKHQLAVLTNHFTASLMEPFQSAWHFKVLKVSIAIGWLSWKALFWDLAAIYSDLCQAVVRILYAKPLVVENGRTWCSVFPSCHSLSAELAQPIAMPFDVRYKRGLVKTFEVTMRAR